MLDTNVVSGLRVRGRNPAVEVWAATIAVDDLFITATSVAVIEVGVHAKAQSDAEQGSVLRRWFDEKVLPTFEGRVLSFDLAAARVLAIFIRSELLASIRGSSPDPAPA